MFTRNLKPLEKELSWVTARSSRSRSDSGRRFPATHLRPRFTVFHTHGSQQAPPSCDVLTFYSPPKGQDSCDLLHSQADLHPFYSVKTEAEPRGTANACPQIFESTPSCISQQATLPSFSEGTEGGTRPPEACSQLKRGYCSEESGGAQAQTYFTGPGRAPRAWG